MLRVTVQLIPRGNENLALTVATLDITNATPGSDGPTGDYEIEAWQLNPAGEQSRWTRWVEGWPRERGPLGLIAQAIAAIGDRL